MIIQRYLYPTLNPALRHLLSGVLLYLALCASAFANEHRILVLGDSISAAYGMSLEQGWVTLMAAQLQIHHPDYEVINASISGETTVGGLQRLPALLQEHKPQLLLIELGGNDGLRGYPLKTLRANLAAMARLAREAGTQVVLLPMEIPPNYGSRYTQGFRDSFRIVAEQTGSGLSVFLMDGVALEDGMMQTDGIHPTARAQQRLAANVLPTVLRVLERP